MTRTKYQEAEIHPALVAALTSAKCSIQLAIGWISEPGILGLLQKKALAGIEVEIILFQDGDSQNTLFNGQTSSESVRLVRVGESLKEQLIDAKFGLIDGGEIVIEGDYRWRAGTAGAGREIILSSDAHTLATAYRQEFNYLFHHGEMASGASKPIFGLPDLIKRLEVMQTLFKMEDTDYLAFRLDGLREFSEDPDIAFIVDKIEEEEFASAYDEVTAFIENHRLALACINPPIDNLLHEIQQLERQISEVSQEVADTQKRMSAFSKLHGEKLGDLLEGILFETKIKAKRLAEADPGKQEIYEEAASDHEKYTSSQEAVRKNKTRALDAREQKELKRLYRKASMKCHPDRVVDELHDQAQAIFLELTEAYKNNDLEQLRAITEQLNNNRMADKSEVLTERKKLESTRKGLIDKLAEWNNQLEELLRQPNSKTINAIDDWDDYFNETRVLLEDQLFRLRTENKAAKIQQEKSERLRLTVSGKEAFSD
ncbi:phospholipase D-like domain-containing protein [Neolewinella agarilytica]|uniref:phospholipase D-like domain-containing protein n=1 Tax=Neolewinella agarilytica TaxID=478744 RepID=UPI002353981A|nr:hypothetical protein [Neolewinella agarilytica]